MKNNLSPKILIISTLVFSTVVSHSLLASEKNKENKKEKSSIKINEAERVARDIKNDNFAARVLNNAGIPHPNGGKFPVTKTVRFQP